MMRLGEHVLTVFIAFSVPNQSENAYSTMARFLQCVLSISIVEWVDHRRIEGSTELNQLR